MAEKTYTIAIGHSAHQLLKLEAIHKGTTLRTVVEELVLAHYGRKGYTDRIVRDFVGDLDGARHKNVNGEDL